MALVEYKPYKDVNDFHLEYQDDQPEWLLYNGNPESSFRLKIKRGGYIPKSGIFLCQSITSIVKGKTVLDIGTGETGVISIYCSRHKAASITALDIDEETVNWAKYNGEINGVTNINWLVSDKFDKVDEKFDLIVSNPPQMPMTDGPLHDSGGKDGRSVIDNIINESAQHLNRNGSVVLLVFDFLSVDRRLGDKITVFDLLEKNGFQPQIVAEAEKVVRPQGKTFEALEDIQKFYPRYVFSRNDQGELFYKMQIVKGVLK